MKEGEITRCPRATRSHLTWSWDCGSGFPKSGEGISSSDLEALGSLSEGYEGDDDGLWLREEHVEHVSLLSEEMLLETAFHLCQGPGKRGEGGDDVVLQEKPRSADHSCCSCCWRMR